MSEGQKDLEGIDWFFVLDRDTAWHYKGYFEQLDSLYNDEIGEAGKRGTDYPALITHCNNLFILGVEKESDILVASSTIILVEQRFHKFALIEGFVVHPSFRQRKIGSVMLSEVLEFVRTNGCSYAELHTKVRRGVGPDKTYTRAGFKLFAKAAEPGASNYYRYNF